MYEPPLNIIAIDPGYTNGVASLYMPENKGTPVWSAWQTDSVYDTIDWVDVYVEEGPYNILLVEDFVGAGVLTKEAKETIRRLGFFDLSHRYHPYLSVECPTPQKRLCRLELATMLCNSRDIEGPHSWDALAHILAWLERNNVQSTIF